jgi:hypothetical protein
MKPGRPTAQYNPMSIWARDHQVVYAGPQPHVPHRACPRRGGTIGRPPPHAGAADQLATYAPHAAHAATTSSCVPRLYPLCSCHTEVKFFSVSSPLASALLLPRELAVTTVSRPPCHRPNRGTRPPPSPPRIALRLSSRRGPPAPELAHHRMHFLCFTGHRRSPPPVLLRPRRPRQ